MKTHDRAESTASPLRAAVRNPGMPLEPATRTRFETTFGCDLAHVRIHTDAAAARAAAELDAIAFALGRDVFFAHGAYDPHSSAGRAVLAHELVHTLQDRRSAASFDLAGVDVLPDDATAENEAHDATVPRRGATMPQPREPGRNPRIARLAAGLLARRDAADPAQVVATIVETVCNTLQADPDDRLGRVRRTLIAIDERTRRLVFERLEAQLLSADWHHLMDVLKQDVPAGTTDGDGRSGVPDPATGDDVQAAATAPAPAAPEADATSDTATADGRSAQTDVPETADAGAAAAADPAKDPAQPAMRLHGAHPRKPRGEVAAAAARAQSGRPAAAAAAPIAVPAGGSDGAESAMDDAGAPEPAADTGADVADASDGATAEAVSDGATAEAADGGAEAAAQDAVAEPGAEAVARDAATEPGSDAAATGETAPRASVATGEAPSAETTDAPPEQSGATDAAGAEGADAATGDPAAAGNASAEASAGTATDTAEGASAEAEALGEAQAEPQTGEPEPPSAAEAANEPHDSAAVADAPPASAAASVTQTGLPAEETPDRDESSAGGGGAAIPAPPVAPVPVVPDGAEPAVALGAVAGESPDRLATAIAKVGASVTQTMAGDRRALASQPPQLTPAEAARVAGPVADGPAPAAAAPTAGSIARVPAASGAVATAPAPAPETPGPLPEIPPARITANADGALTAEDAQKVAEAVDELPATDPALNVTVGPAPAVELTGDADPDVVKKQHDRVAAADADAAKAGAIDVAVPMGEEHLLPPPLPLVRAEAPAAAGPGAAGPTAVAGPADPAVAAIARERSGDAVAAQAQQQTGQLTASRAQQSTDAAQKRSDAQRDIDSAIKDDAAEQRTVRGTARSEVGTQRDAWREEQRGTIAAADRDGETATMDALHAADAARKQGDEDARRHVDDGNEKVTAARNEAEATARAEKAKAEKEKDEGGLLSRIGSAVSSFFDSIRDAIHSAFDRARKFVSDAIAAAQKLASAAIEFARKTIVSAIQLAGDALIAIGDRVLAAFPATREKFRAAIKKRVAAAVARVNEVAAAFKAGIQKLLNLLGRALTALLDAYEAMYMAAVNAVASVVKGALDAAKALVEALGVFAVLIVDIARNPGQWIHNLGAALMDGVRNHLWKALKAAVKEWFNSKVEAVVGIGKLIFDVLRKGGIEFKRVAAMVWTAVKAAIPRAIIEFIIQKVIQMIIPAAGAIMAIIEGLQAAWATVSRIVAAFERFVAFLKAVKNGNAGPQFAAAVAAAAIAVIDFTANFIISKIGKGAKGVGTRLKAMAGKLMALFKRGVKAVGRGLRAVGRVVVRGVRAVGRGIAAAGRYVANSRIGRAIRNSRVGKFVGAQVQRLKAAVAHTRERINTWREARRQRRAQSNAGRLDRAVTAIRPKLSSMLSRGVASLRLRGTLLFWRDVVYRIKRLELNQGRIVAANSPPQTVMDVVLARGGDLMARIRRAAYKLMNDRRVLAAEQRLADARAAGGGTSDNPLEIGHGSDLVAGARDIHAGRRAPDAVEHYRPEGLYGRTYAEQQTGVGPGLVETGTIGTYGQILASWKRARGRNPLAPKSSLTDAGLARVLQGYIREGKVPDDFAVSQSSGRITQARGRGLALVGEMSRLMVSTEGARSPSALVEAPMLLHLMAEGRISADQAFASERLPGGPTPLNPAAFVGATEISRQTDLRSFEGAVNMARIRREDPGSARQQRFREQRQRRLDLIGEFIFERLQAADEVFTTHDDVNNFIDREFDKAIDLLLRHSYGMPTQEALLVDLKGNLLVAK